MKKLAFAAAAIVAACLPAAAGAQITFQSAAGDFNTATPGSAQVEFRNLDALPGNDYFRLGQPFDGTDSFLQFTSAAAQAITIGTQFDLGTLTFGNDQTNSGTSATGVQFAVTPNLLVNGNPFATPAFTYQFTINATPNAEPCAYPSTVPCSDLVTVSAVGQQTTSFFLGGNRVTLNIAGFRGEGGSISSSFLADEFTQSRGTLVGTFAISDVPEPASWALMVTGFGAVGGAMRRRRAPAVRARTA